MARWWNLVDTLDFDLKTFSIFLRIYIKNIMRYKYTKEDLENAVKKSKSIASVCRILGVRPAGGNYKTIKSKLKKWNIDYSHFTGQGWNVGLKFKPMKKRPLSEILIKDSDFISTYHLKERLFNESIKEKRCESCNLTEWLGKPIPLELNHINGDNTDHRLENLDILCPNCHAQTPTYRTKNKKSALSEKREVEFRKFGEPCDLGIPSQASNLEEGVET